MRSAPIWLALMALSCTSVVAQAQVIQPFDVPNGPVTAAVLLGNTLYIGGDFTHVGPQTTSAVPLDATTGLPVAGFPRISGCIQTVIADGAGGWYIGGSFNSVGGLPRSNLAHIASDLSVSPWDPHAEGGVSTLVRRGSTIYAGGFFWSMGGIARSHLAAIDATSGLVTSWNPIIPADPDANVFALATSGATIYVGGSFSSIGGQTRRGLAAVDAATGVVAAWDAHLTGGIPRSTVAEMMVVDTTLYAAGNFHGAGGQLRHYLAALSTTTGLVTPWDAHPDNWPITMAANATTLYLGGGFTNIGGEARNYIAAIDRVTGLATAWDPNADEFVATLALNGSTVIVGGAFSQIGGQPRNRIAALDATTGVATGWNPNSDGMVSVLASDGSTIYAGGSFNSVGGQTRNYLAALDVTTGQLIDWDPNADGPISSLAVSGSTVYAAGFFTHVGGQARNRLAALGATTGLASSWDPNPDAPVVTLAVGGSTIYAGGSFTSIGGQPRNRIAALDAATGLASSWDPNANDDVFSLAVSGTTVYAAGDFSSIGGQPRSYLAALDAASGLATAWDPQPSGRVYALAPDGAVVYAGGDFITMGGQKRHSLAALDVTSGQATSWDPSPDGIVLDVEPSGGTVYVAGFFQNIGSISRNGVAALDATSAEAGSWNPNAGLGGNCDPKSADGQVSVLISSGSTIYMGGAFTSLSDLPQRFLAAVGDLTTETQLSLLSAEAGPDRVRVIWFASAPPAGAVTVYRRTVLDRWMPVAEVSADASGRIAYEDHEVSAGGRYGYRLGVREGAGEVMMGETWVDVPRGPEFSLASPRPNPARSLEVSFSLPDGTPARLEAFDVAGRVRFVREVGTLGLGRHVVNLSAERSLAPGLYLVRLSRAGRSLTARAIVIP